MRLEHLRSDIAALEEYLGFRIDVGHANASVRDQDYRAYYTNDLRDHVARICADDILLNSRCFRVGPKAGHHKLLIEKGC